MTSLDAPYQGIPISIYLKGGPQFDKRLKIKLIFRKSPPKNVETTSSVMTGAKNKWVSLGLFHPRNSSINGLHCGYFTLRNSLINRFHLFFFPNPEISGVKLWPPIPITGDFGGSAIWKGSNPTRS